MNESVDKERLEITNRMETSRNIIGIVNLLGCVGILYDLIVWGFSADSLVWAVAWSMGLLYWYQARLFLFSGDDEIHAQQIKALKKYFNVYVFCWILGATLTLFIWREIEVTTAIGVILVLFSTYMMSRFQGDAALLMLEE